MVTFNNPIRVFNGVGFYDVSNKTTVTTLFSSVAMERGYAYGHPCTTGSGLTKRVPDVNVKSRKPLGVEVKTEDD